MLTASESAFQGEVDELAGCVGKLVHSVTMMLQKCNRKMEDVLFKCDSLQARLGSAGSQLSGSRKSFQLAHELLQEHPGSSAASNSQLEKLLVSSVSSFVDRVTCLVSAKVAAHEMRLMDVLTYTCSSLEFDSQSVVTLPCSAL